MGYLRQSASSLRSWQSTMRSHLRYNGKHWLSHLNSLVWHWVGVAGNSDWTKSIERWDEDLHSVHPYMDNKVHRSRLNIVWCRHSDENRQSTLLHLGICKLGISEMLTMIWLTNIGSKFAGRINQFFHFDSSYHWNSYSCSHRLRSFRWFGTTIFVFAIRTLSGTVTSLIIGNACTVSAGEFIIWTS